MVDLRQGVFDIGTILEKWRREAFASVDVVKRQLFDLAGCPARSSDDSRCGQNHARAHGKITQKLSARTDSHDNPPFPTVNEPMGLRPSLPTPLCRSERVAGKGQVELTLA